jgi:sigma-E factor negative regulatory protein RseC
MPVALMIEQQGRVMALGKARVTILLGAGTGCPSCDAGKGCGAGIFGRLAGRKPIPLELSMEGSKHLPLVAGQAVRVGIPESVFLGLVARFYLLPVIAALLGAALGHTLALLLQWNSTIQDVLALLGALILGTLTLLTSRNRKALQSNEGVVQILGYPAMQPDQLCGMRQEVRP